MGGELENDLGGGVISTSDSRVLNVARRIRAGHVRATRRYGSRWRGGPLDGVRALRASISPAHSVGTSSRVSSANGAVTVSRLHRDQEPDLELTGSRWGHSRGGSRWLPVNSISLAATAPGLRVWHSFLSGQPSHSIRGTHRARRSPEALPEMEDRLGSGSKSPHGSRARLGITPRNHPEERVWRQLDVDVLSRSSSRTGSISPSRRFRVER